jgi:hypothetical protein
MLAVIPEALAERDLIEVILSDATITDAVKHLVSNMLETKADRLRKSQTRAPFNGEYRVNVQGRQVTSGAYQHRFTTNTVKPEPAS